MPDIKVSLNSPNIEKLQPFSKQESKTTIPVSLWVPWVGS